MPRIDRRAVKAAYRERTPDWAICALRIGDKVWVTATADCVALENRFGFMLRQGASRIIGMDAAFAAAGGFTLERLETLDDTLGAVGRETLIKDRLAYWQHTLGAGRF